MGDPRGPFVVVVTSAATDHQLHRLEAVLTRADIPARHGGHTGRSRLPEGVIKTFSLSTSSPAPADVIKSVVDAAYLVIQEPTSGPGFVHVAAVTAAAARDIPILLVHPDSRPMPELARIADLQISQMLAHPVTADAKEAWARFWEGVNERARLIVGEYEDAANARLLSSVTDQLSIIADTIRSARTTKDIAETISCIVDAQARGITVVSTRDYLQLEFPLQHYPKVLQQLRERVGSVHTIVDPLDDRLQWDDRFDAEMLGDVTERIFFLDDSSVNRRIKPLARAIEVARGRVSVVRLTAGLFEDLTRITADGPALAGFNRFFAGDNIVGGYVDSTSSRLRMLVYHQSRSSAYERQREFLREIERLRHTPPVGYNTTELASWIYREILERPRISALYNNTTAEYAEQYDGSIVQVTPRYFEQLDGLADEFKRALFGLYAPFSTSDRRGICVLEIGVGTGALTERLYRAASEFCNVVIGARYVQELPVTRIDGYDENPAIVDRARKRIAYAADRASDRPQERRSQSDATRVETRIHPNLRPEKFDPRLPAAEPVYDIIIGSLVAHYWVDVLPDAGRQPELRMFGEFLQGVRARLVDGGLAMFLDAFYTPGKRVAERERWRDYIKHEVGTFAQASDYERRNPQQFAAPDIDDVTAVARSAGFDIRVVDAAPGYPFKILILRKVS
jgi:SAM-dependent methyltransferase